MAYKKKSTAQTKTLTGPEYQAQISLYFGIHLHQNTDNDYELNSELNDTGDLNDFYATFWNKIDEKHLCFLQVKYFTEKGNAGTLDYCKFVCNAKYDPFSLVKYFESYQILKKRLNSSTDKTVSMYLSTNGIISNKKNCDKVMLMPNKGRPSSNLNCSGKEELELATVMDENDRSCLFFQRLEAKLYKISNNNIGETELYMRLKKANIFFKMLEVFSQYLLIGYSSDPPFKGPYFTTSKQIFRIYHGTFVKYKIVDAQKKLLHEDFINGNLNDFTEVMNFRNEIFQQYKKRRETCDKNPQMLNDDEVKAELMKKKLSMGKTFGKGVHLFNETLCNPTTFAKQFFDCIHYKTRKAGNIVNLDRRSFKLPKTETNQRNNIDRVGSYILKDSDEDVYYSIKNEFFHSDNNFAMDDNNQLREDLIIFKNELVRLFNIEGSDIEKLRSIRFSIPDYVSIKTVEPFPSQTEVSDEDIKSFFANFFLAVNQPGDIVEELQKSVNNDNSLTDKLLRETAAWIKKDDSEPWNREKLTELMPTSCSSKQSSTGTEILKKDVASVISSYLEKIDHLNESDVVEDKDLKNLILDLTNL